jgi:hypothetical protein
VDGTGAGSCPVVRFGISGDEPPRGPAVAECRLYHMFWRVLSMAGGSRVGVLSDCQDRYVPWCRGVGGVTLRWAGGWVAESMRSLFL